MGSMYRHAFSRHRGRPNRAPLVVVAADQAGRSLAAHLRVLFHFASPDPGAPRPAPGGGRTPGCGVRTEFAPKRESRRLRCASQMQVPQCPLGQFPAGGREFRVDRCDSPDVQGRRRGQAGRGREEGGAQVGRRVGGVGAVAAQGTDPAQALVFVSGVAVGVIGKVLLGGMV